MDLLYTGNPDKSLSWFAGELSGKKPDSSLIAAYRQPPAFYESYTFTMSFALSRIKIRTRSGSSTSTLLPKLSRKP